MNLENLFGFGKVSLADGRYLHRRFIGRRATAMRHLQMLLDILFPEASLWVVFLPPELA